MKSLFIYFSQDCCIIRHLSFKFKTYESLTSKHITPEWFLFLNLTIIYIIYISIDSYHINSMTDTTYAYFWFLLLQSDKKCKCQKYKTLSLIYASKKSHIKKCMCIKKSLHMNLIFPFLYLNTCVFFIIEAMSGFVKII